MSEGRVKGISICWRRREGMVDVDGYQLFRSIMLGIP